MSNNPNPPLSAEEVADIRSLAELSISYDDDWYNTSAGQDFSALMTPQAFLGICTTIDSQAKRIEELEAAQEWREVAKEKPPLEKNHSTHSVRVEVANFVGDTGWDHEGWARSKTFYDFANGEWLHGVEWTHWKLLGDNPKEGGAGAS